MNSLQRKIWSKQNLSKFKLSREEKDLVNLRFSGKSYEEVAIWLNRSVDDVRLMEKEVTLCL